MAFCGSCGKPLEDGIRFCGACGAPAPEPAEGIVTPETSEDTAVEVPADVRDTVVTPGARYCPKCGHPADSPAAFCAKCGAAMAATAAGAGAAAAAVTQAMVPAAQAATTAPLPQSEATLQQAAAAPPAYSPVVSGFETQPVAGGYGQPDPYGQATPSTQPGQYAQPGRYDSSLAVTPVAGRKVKPLAIALAIVAVALVALGGAAFLTTRDGNDQKPTGAENGSSSSSSSSGSAGSGSAAGGASASPSTGGSGFESAVGELLAPVSAAQSEANDAVKAVENSEESLAAAQAAGEALASAVTAAESAAGGLEGESTTGDTVIKALLAALAAQGYYADVLASLPDTPAELTPAAATAVAAAGQKATDALEGFANSAGATSAAMAAGLVAPEAYNEIEALARKLARDRALKAYLVKIEDLMKRSGKGRENVVKAINGVSGRTIDPTTAGGLIDAVYENRRAVLRRVKALKPPADPRAKQIKKQFSDALAFSLKADTAFAYWILAAHDEYYRSPEGYKGAVDLNADYQGGVRWSAKASASKAKLVAAYNKFAKKYGLKHDWVAQDI